MNGYGSLFERLGGEAGQRAGWSREVAVMASVAAHLAKMLSTRAGSVQTLPDYGLPDLNDMRLSLHDALQQARSAIESFIEKYEPRLSQVRVSSAEAGGRPCCFAQLRAWAARSSYGIRQTVPTFSARKNSGMGK